MVLEETDERKPWIAGLLPDLRNIESTKLKDHMLLIHDDENEMVAKYFPGIIKDNLPRLVVSTMDFNVLYNEPIPEGSTVDSVLVHVKENGGTIND